MPEDISLEDVFPNLAAAGYQWTSEDTSDYNCIAFAAGITDQWWWPTLPYHWPNEIPRETTLDSFRMAFQLRGYEVCESREVELGFEKVAIYTDQNGVPTHAARQLEDGMWISKLGNWEDIEHNTLEAIEGTFYGRVALLLKRAIR